MNVKTKKAERSEATRAALMKAARELFTEYGYAETSTEQIVERTGVTRGALYYQFRDKADLFRAVFEEVDAELIASAARAMQSSQADLWERVVRGGCRAFLNACLEPAVQRIILVDGPAVLGWETWRQLDEDYGAWLIRQTLQTIMDAGLIAPQPIEPLTYLILGALSEAALYMARAKDLHTARSEMGASVDRLLDGLRIVGG